MALPVPPSSSPAAGLSGAVERPPLLALISGAVPDGTSVAAPTEAGYRAFLDALDVAVYTTDSLGRITFFNEAAATFWGRRPELGEEWCGSWRLYWPDGSGMRHDECPMAIALRENRSVRGHEAIVERPDGTRRWFIPYPTPLRAGDGTLIGAVNVLVDVTERAVATEELRATAEALRVSNAVKDEFLGLVSHELRTPVTTIFGNARLLHERGDRLDDPQKRSMVDDIATDADRLMALIENLLLLTRLGSNPEAELEPQVLDHVVTRAVGSFERRHPLRQIRVVREPGHVVVDGDRTWLEILIDNLLSNADKYSPVAEPIDVVVRVVAGHAEVLVRDRGIGLEAGEAARIFEPFYRGELARVQANGVGVGLAVCRRVVELLRGRIWARRRRGLGTEVGFALPLSTDGVDQPPSPPAWTA